MKVRDTWFTEPGKYSTGWGLGTVIKKNKTNVHINFLGEGLVVFDIPHLRFLEKV